MELFKLVKTFRKDEDGAVTVDWVVLTAAIVGLGIAVMVAISENIGNVTNAIKDDLDKAVDIDLGGSAGGSDNSGGSNNSGGNTSNP